MQSIASTQAKDKFGYLIDLAQREPVEITRKGRPVAYALSPEEYESMGGKSARLMDAIDRVRAEAESNGIAPDILNQLISDA